MTTFIVDWQPPKENTIAELNKNHFKLNPLDIKTKDGRNFEMDARMIMEIDDESIIVKYFGSFPVFVDNILSVLVRNYFTYKEIAEITVLVRNYFTYEEIAEITSCRLKIQDQFSELAQEKLKKYGVKIISFTIVNTSTLSSFSTKDECML
jgi:hypothetical protein